MARIAGVDIPNNKRIEIALTYIYGIGRKSANDILADTGINPDTRAKDSFWLSAENCKVIVFFIHATPNLFNAVFSDDSSWMILNRPDISNKRFTGGEIAQTTISP